MLRLKKSIDTFVNNILWPYRNGSKLLDFITRRVMLIFCVKYGFPNLFLLKCQGSIIFKLGKH